MKLFLYRYRFILSCVPLFVAGALILNYVNSSISKKEEDKRKIELEGAHEDAKSLIQNQVNSLAILTSGIGSYIKYADSLPDSKKLRNYVGTLVDHLDYDDSLIVSFIDTSFEFVSTFSRTHNDPSSLVGTNVAQFRSQEELNKLRYAMEHEEIVMFEPFNLVEGWPGIAMHFGIYRDNKPVGYVVPVINLEYILEGIYDQKNTSKFVYQFQTSKKNFFDRFTVYDGSEVFNDRVDSEYWGTSGVDSTQFITSELDIFDYKLTIGTAHKKELETSSFLSTLMYLWLFLLALFISFVIWQMTRSNKLAKKLQIAKTQLERLSIVAQETENIVLIMDAEGNVEWVNESFERLNQVTYDELIADRGKNIRDISNSDTIKHLIDQAIDTKKPVQYDSLNTRNEGQRVWESSTLTPIYNDQGTLTNLIIIDTDITERKDAEDLLIEKTKEIVDSINYAKRLQEAILPSRDFIKGHFPESFILYSPKDIVAGDFYWFEEIEDFLYIAVADCTGHGVPGAMVSVVCNNALNKAVIEEGLRDPGEILDRASDLVTSRFNSSSNVKDGMDISFCRIDKKKRELAYSGAYSPIYLVNQLTDVNAELKFRSETHWLKEIKANKQPIGSYEHRTKFDTHKLELEENQALYLFSDGYYDQFGGEKGKKFKTANFKRLLLKIHGNPMSSQIKSLSDSLEEWKGDFEQVDDICVIGLKI